jgi:hypothetical protein
VLSVVLYRSDQMITMSTASFRPGPTGQIVCLVLMDLAVVAVVLSHVSARLNVNLRASAADAITW